MSGTLPLPALEENAVLDWSANPAVLAVPSQFILYEFGLLTAAEYAKLVVCGLIPSKHTAVIVPDVVRIGALTVNVAALELVLHVPENTTQRYWYVFMPAVAPVIFSVAVVALL